MFNLARSSRFYGRRTLNGTLRQILSSRATATFFVDFEFLRLDPCDLSSCRQTGQSGCALLGSGSRGHMRSFVVQNLAQPSEDMATRVSALGQEMAETRRLIAVSKDMLRQMDAALVPFGIRFSAAVVLRRRP